MSLCGYFVLPAPLLSNYLIISVVVRFPKFLLQIPLPYHFGSVFYHKFSFFLSWPQRNKGCGSFSNVNVFQCLVIQTLFVCSVLLTLLTMLSQAPFSAV